MYFVLAFSCAKVYNFVYSIKGSLSSQRNIMKGATTMYFFSYLFGLISELFLADKPEGGKDVTILTQLGQWLDSILPIKIG